MKIEGKFILKVAGTLTAISLVVAALLGATNALTEDKIAAINKANTEVALAAVVSSPDCEFPPIEEIPQAAIDAAKTQSGKLTEAYRVVVNGEDAGYAFKIVAGGVAGRHRNDRRRGRRPGHHGHLRGRRRRNERHRHEGHRQ